MIATQTFWLNKADIWESTSGWPDMRFNLFSWALSCHQLNKFFPSVSLTTDALGKYLMIDLLELPYSEVNTGLEKFHLEFDNIWSLKKIYAYSTQDKPFVHVDGDAYLFSPLSEKLLNSSLIAQNYEYDHSYYLSGYNNLKSFPFVPTYVGCLDKDRVSSINAGIIGGNNVGFFKLFFDEVITFLDKNRHRLNEIDSDYINVIIEQYLFKQLADYNNITIDYFLDYYVDKQLDYNLDRFYNLPKMCDYIHVMNYKNNSTVCEQMAQRLWIETPELYSKATSVCKKLAPKNYFKGYRFRQIHESFARTRVLTENLLGPQYPNNLSKKNLAHALKEKESTKYSDLIFDVLDYENQIKKYINKLPNAKTLWDIWKSHSIKINNFFSLDSVIYKNKLICKSKLFSLVDSEWDWAEKNEFEGQTFRGGIINNLEVEPLYYESVLYIYLNLKIIREHRLDLLNIMIMESLASPSSMLSVFETVESIIKMQNVATIDQKDLVTTIERRLRFFLYNGILDIIE